MSKDEAFAAIDMMLSDNKLGDAGARVVIEEFLDGRGSQLHRDGGRQERAGDGDQPGSQAPAGWRQRSQHRRHGRLFSRARGHAAPPRESIARSDPAGRARHGKEGITYTGFLYAGLMISPDGGIKVLEFNCRMGDPETQPIMLRLKSDFAAIVEHAINGTLDKVEAEWDRRTALGVVMAAANYPDTPRKGDVITGLPERSWKTRMCSMRARQCRMARWSPMADVCCASPHWATW